MRSHILQEAFLDRAAQAVYILVAIVDLSLFSRLCLKFFGANPEAGFAQFIYTMTRPFMAPFTYLFEISRVEGRVFDWGIVAAILSYWVLGVLILKVIDLFEPLPPVPTVGSESQSGESAGSSGKMERIPTPRGRHRVP